MIIELAERGWVPDPLLRFGIRRLLSRRIGQERARARGDLETHKHEFIEGLSQGSVAEAREQANEQHYEVPAAFFREVLGPWLKYSCCLWDKEVRTLAEAELAMLRLYGERAGLADGQQVLDLGCGWGSFSLWAAETFPGSEITAVSNSASQREYIEQQARLRALPNLCAVTADAATLAPAQQYDRVVSVEMFEHMRNHRLLMDRIHDWLVPGGILFVHVFCHRELLYAFEDEGSTSWMARNFFTGGIMPSRDLLPRVSGRLALEQQWDLNGMHYARTLESWLDNLDSRHERLLPVARDAAGGLSSPEQWLQRWRIFFMACAELFAYRGGEQWLVGHYRFRRPQS